MRVRVALLGCLLASVAACWGRFDLLHPYELATDGPVTWERYLGEGESCGHAVRQTPDGGFLLVGETNEGSVDFDLLLEKTDATGSEVWSRRYGGGSEEHGNSIQTAADGGYVVAGSTSSFGAGEEDVYLLKIDSDGDEQWSRTFGGAGMDGGWCVQCTDDGGYIITGYTSPGAGVNDVYLLKTDADGVEQWSRTYGWENEDRGFCVRQTANGGYVIAGLTEAHKSGDDNAFLIKTDADGVMEWSKVFGGTEELDSGTSVVQARDGGYVLVGYTHSYGAGDFDAWAIKTDAEGQEEWSRTYGGAAWDRADCIEATNDGGYIVAGMTKSFGTRGGRKQAWLIKTDDDGTVQWSQDFGGESDEWGHCVLQTADGGFILAGEGNALAYLVYFKP